MLIISPPAAARQRNTLSPRAALLISVVLADTIFFSGICTVPDPTLQARAQLESQPSLSSNARSRGRGCGMGCWACVSNSTKRRERRQHGENTPPRSKGKFKKKKTRQSKQKREKRQKRTQRIQSERQQQRPSTSACAHPFSVKGFVFLDFAVSSHRISMVLLVKSVHHAGGTTHAGP